LQFAPVGKSLLAGVVNRSPFGSGMISWLLTWEVLVSLAGCLIFIGGIILSTRVSNYLRGRQLAVEEADVPWEELVDLLRAHNEGIPEAEQAVSEDELLRSLLDESRVFNKKQKLAPSTTDRRRNRRRWLNPIEVDIISPFHEQPLHGLIVNRSAGGLAILADIVFDAGAVLRVRRVDAPPEVDYIEVCVRNTRAASHLWVMGCQYKDEIPLQSKAWFG
jgi:hypothetical protein